MEGRLKPAQCGLWRVPGRASRAKCGLSAWLAPCGDLWLPAAAGEPQWQGKSRDPKLFPCLA